MFQVIFLHLAKLGAESLLLRSPMKSTPGWFVAQLSAQQDKGRWDAWPWPAFLGIQLPAPWTRTWFGSLCFEKYERSKILSLEHSDSWGYIDRQRRHGSHIQSELTCLYCYLVNMDNETKKCKSALLHTAQPEEDPLWGQNHLTGYFLGPVPRRTSWRPIDSVLSLSVTLGSTQVSWVDLWWPVSPSRLGLTSTTRTLPLD